LVLHENVLGVGGDELTSTSESTVEKDLDLDSYVEDYVNDQQNEGESVPFSKNFYSFDAPNVKEENVEIVTLSQEAEKLLKSDETVFVHSTPEVPVYVVNEGNDTNSHRLLVNISIGSDTGSGTIQHTVYSLHVSVPTPEIKDTPLSCPPEPPPQPPCPIKCSNFPPHFETYKYHNIYEDYEDNSTTLDDNEAPVTTTQSPIEDEDEEEPVNNCPEIFAPILILEGTKSSTNQPKYPSFCPNQNVAFPCFN
jgi:hypothetical protein